MTRLGLGLVFLIGCVGVPEGQGTGSPDAAGGSGDGGGGGDGGAGGLVPGSLAVSWMHGEPSCAGSTSPELQVHAYNATTYILRQNKCDTFEAPFIYLLLGTDQALLLDTGGTATTTLRETVKPLIGTRSLIITHTHAHGDHKAGDATFTGQPSMTMIAPTRAAIQSAFAIATWPTDVGHYELGGRMLDVLAIPGHEATHIAIYDQQTGLLLTGDSLYPGLLFINDWTTYRDSMGRLADFVAPRPIAHVLGAHIEMQATPGQVYPYGTTYQPNEHVLQLTKAHVVELDAALTALGPTKPAQAQVHDDFIIDPQ